MIHCVTTGPVYIFLESHVLTSCIGESYFEKLAVA
jgi:hypothetical protein